MQENPLSSKKKVFFSIFLVLIPIFFLLIFESSLRLIHSGSDLSLFTKSKTYTGYYEVNRMVGKRFFTKLPATSSINDLFLIDKPDSCYRIFILGGSTAQGFPYQSGISFGRILNYRLQDAFPHRLIEVVNLAMVATNSYTQADFIDEVLAQQPDAILIYSGHNEYYGALGVGSVENGGNVRWLKRLNLKLVHLRTYQLLQQIIAKTFKTFSGDLTNKPTATLMEHIAKDKAIEFGSTMFNDGVKQFKDNMEEIFQKANQQHVPILIGELVSNVRDIKPFKSISSAQNPRAETIYSNAQHFDSLGDYETARTLYYQAKDLDAIRFRAPEALNEVIHSLGKKYNVPIVPIKSIFEQHSTDGIIGNQLMLEHLHPNVDGYFLLADAFFIGMKNNNFISDEWNQVTQVSSDYYRKHWGFTALDSLVADLLIKKLMSGWPFQPDSVVNQFRFTYQPVSYEDSMAFMCIKYNNITVYSQHLEVAKHFASLGQYHKAFEEYYALIKSEPHKSSLYYEAADFLIKANEPFEAASLLKTIPNISKDCKGLLKLGQCYQLGHNLPLAVSSFESAVAVSQPMDDRETALLLLYNACKEDSQLEKSKNVLDKLAKIDRKYLQLASEQNAKVILADQDVKPLLDSALVYARSGNLKEANALLQRSLKIQETEFAYSMLGSIFFKKDNVKALVYFNKAYQMNPQDANVLNNLCVLSIMKKDFALASKYLDELSKVSGNADQIKGLTNQLNKSKTAN